MSKRDFSAVNRSLREKRSINYLPIIFLIALITVILVDVLNG